MQEATIPTQSINLSVHSFEKPGTIMSPQEQKKDPSIAAPLDIEAAVGGTTVLNKEEGYYLRWSRLYKSVQTLDTKAHASAVSFRKTETEKVILNSMSGSAAPGEVLACMGPSGSGKTSLMNVLSGRSSFQQGTISINGVPLTKTAMKKLMRQVAYVKQEDIFFQHLTVRDQLTYTALLRLPKHLSKAQKLAEVDRLLGRLRLHKVAESKIRMVSGGEKKRVNIGTELLTDPKILLLDEPTSKSDLDEERSFAIWTDVPSY
jgi:ABC-type multidrug transport system ATPase subunit